MRVAAIHLVAVLALSACFPPGLESATTPSKPLSASPTLAGSPPASPPGNCTGQEELSSVMREFFEAFNSARFSEIDALFGTSFESYSESYELRLQEHVTFGKRDALAYLRERHAAGDRFAFRGVRLTELRAWDGATHFGIDLGLERNGVTLGLVGKGALYCRGPLRGIKVLALGIAP